MKRPWKWKEDGYTVIRSNARTGPGCHNCCGVLLYVKDGKLEKVEGDPENPFNQGRLCPRCLAYTQVLYHPDRLKYPLKRVGKRGENKWERISWDEAYDYIEGHWRRIINEYGPESLAFFQGTGRDISGYLGRLGFAIGSPNYACGFLAGMACYVPRMLSFATGVGDAAIVDCSQYTEQRYDHPDFRVPEISIVWGANPPVTNADGNLGHWIVEMMKRGSKLITVDPKLTWMAAHSEYFLQIRPGTDAALALAIGHIIIAEDLYDHDFVENWGYGFEDYAKRCSEYPPEEVAQICGIDVEDIYDVARAYAKADRAALHMGLSLDQVQEGLHASIALRNLWGLTGNVEKPGTHVLGKPCYGLSQTWRGGWGFEDVLPDEQKEKRIGQEYPAFMAMAKMSAPSSVTDAMITGKPYPIKGACLFTNNGIACMGAEAKKVHQALLNMEFNVVADLFMTPTALACADVVLPAATFAERNGICGHNPYYIGAIVQAVEPVGECKSDQQILIELGCRFNKEAYPWENEMEMYEDILKETGYTWTYLRDHTWQYPEFEYYRHEKAKLRDDGEKGFNTATSMFEFCTSILESLGYDPLPFYREPPESHVSTPDLAEKYPLILTTGARKVGLFHSEHRQVPAMRRMHPWPLAMIHPDTAAKYGVREGDWLWIENHLGRCKQKADISLAIRPDTVSIDHGWWYPERDPDDGTLFGVFESNANNLIAANPGHTGIGNAYKSSLCIIYRCEEGGV